MNLSREEQETLIRTSAAVREWNFFTLDPKFVRRLEKLGYQLKKDHQGGWSCQLPLNRITIRRAEKGKLTERQRAHLARNRFKLKNSQFIAKNSDQSLLDDG